jgi:purine-binding chemotaxis protein CheW
MTALRMFCTFTLDSRLYGIEVDRVSEVLRYHPLTRIPLVPAAIAGLLNLRGQVVLAIDLRARLGIATPRPEQPPVHVILRSTDGFLCLIADEIGPILSVDEQAFERIPETVGGPQREIIRGAYKLKDRLLLVLDPDKAIDVNVAQAPL